MINAVQKNFCGHLWYLTEQLVVFALCDKELSNQERTQIASQLLLQAKPQHFPPGKPKFPAMNLFTDNPELHTFVGPKSWLLFHKLEIEGR